jgi:hypothetical protein
VLARFPDNVVSISSCNYVLSISLHSLSINSSDFGLTVVIGTGGSVAKEGITSHDGSGGSSIRCAKHSWYKLIFGLIFD